MKKPFSLLILVIVFCGGARAQQKAPFHRWSFDLTGGAAFPVGQFGHTEQQNPVSGTVHTGSIVEFSSTFHLNHSWGITLLAGRQQHHSDIDKDYIIVPGTGVPGPGYAAWFTPQHWSMTRILAGGAYTHPLNQKKNLALLVRALAGIEKAHSSEYSYSVDYQDWNGFSILPAPNLPWTLAYQADAGLQYHLCPRLSVLAFAGYSGCRPSYEQDIYELIAPTANFIPNAPHTYKKIYFSTGSILLRAGVRYDL